MTFKANWEKTQSQYQLPAGMVEKMVLQAYPNKKLLSYSLISGGCANLNIKIQLQGERNPLNLRVYLRDNQAAYREQKLAALLHKKIPIPLTNTISEVDGYTFAITEFMPGITLRDLLLSDLFQDVSGIMFEVGVLLSKIGTHTFSKSGFFDNDLQVITPISSEDYLIFAKDCLSEKTVLSVLSEPVISNINRYLDLYSHLFPDDTEKHLVHADFDPANILVHQIDGAWKISGVLDWEFAFSGSILCDVANMLRYAHQMPVEYQYSFLQGLRRSGNLLPENWSLVVRLLNLTALLDCLKRSNPEDHPNRCSDIRELIDQILQELVHIDQYR